MATIMATGSVSWGCRYQCIGGFYIQLLVYTPIITFSVVCSLDSERKTVCGEMQR